MTEPSASTSGAAAAVSASASDEPESASVLPSNKITTPRSQPHPDSTVDHPSSSPSPSRSRDDPSTSKSPLRPPPIITDSLPASATAQHDAALLSPDSPLSALSTPPESPTDDLFHSATPAPSTNGDTNGQLGSGLTNGHARAAETPEDDRPAKRRRVRDSTPPPPGSKTRKIYESPPWKKFEAEGPTTIIEGGKRKSGRLNTVPLEQMSSDKRITRKSYSLNSPPSKLRQGSANGQAARQRAVSASKTLASKSSAASKPPARKSLGHEPRSTPRNRRPSPPPAQSSRSSTRSRRLSRNGLDSLDNDLSTAQPTRTTPRIKLRVNRVPLTELPLVHPDRAKKKRVAANIEEYLRDAYNKPITDGGQLMPEDDPVFTDEMAQAEAKTIIRIEDEARPDGLLGNSCVIFEPEAAEEPPRQYAHMDHLVKAAQNLRKWMVREQREHRDKAKKLAEACQAVWRSRQPKSHEEIEREARDMWIGRYRAVVKALFGTWENVRIEVNRRRMEEWEAEEQKRVKAALQEAVSRSEQQLLARQAQFDSDMSDDDLDEDSEPMVSDSGDSRISGDDEVSVDGPSDEDNMSSSEEDDDRKSAASDEGLTQEQLREKYANLPDIETKDDTHDAGGDTSMAEVLANDTSDESVDMDDDMGSSDDSSNGSGSDDDADGSGSEEGRPSGLLGLIFGEKELKKLQEDTGDSAAEPSDAPMTEADPTGPSPGEKTATATASAADHPAMPKLNNETAGSVATSGVDQKMTDASPPSEGKPQPAMPETTPTAPPSEAVQTTPEVDAATNPVSPDRSQSPRTSDTKPSDVDTATSVERMSGPLEASRSRSGSPQPAAPRTEVPFLLRGTLREYQHYGLDWLSGLYANNTNGILADEMGLGKTIQTIALLAHLACTHGIWGPHLVIVPTSVILNWEMEFKKWCPGFKILTYYGNQEERKRKRQGWTNDDFWNVCITSYQIVLQDAQVFRRRRWHYMILDEAHNIKNFRSQRWQILLGFNTHSRLLLTGTPLQNNLTELWSLLFFLMPSENGVGGFADLKEFHDWFARPESQILEHGREQMDDEARAIISKLHKVLRPYLLRRLKADVEKQMPAKIEHVEFCRLSKRQRELYDGFLARSSTRDTLSSGNYLSIINCLMQLRKVCNHPDLFVDRPIMTSFRMEKSVAADYEVTEQLLRKKLLAPKPMSSVDLGFLNLVPTQHEELSNTVAERFCQLSSNRVLLDLRETQRIRSQASHHILDPSTVKSTIGYLDSAARWGRFEELQHCVYLNALRRQQRPIYGKRLREFLTIGADKRPYRPRPRVPKLVMSWFEEDSFILRTMIPTLDQRAASMERTISKFACVTPAAVTRDMEPFLLGWKGVQAFGDADLRLSAPVRRLPFIPPERPIDPWHESRMRLSIQFPDKRLLQYDCGKLQALDKLLRKLQAGGHRALIFTQMTKVLDILEQFLNIHGHKYLRLDGSTKVEQRQILCDRFNVDNRILCFILSTRSGGLGLNLTGADTVIFYDQDWNPAMDKQCQDRCHRIGQTRDVHIYRLVSEHTIEANILRKASQKQMLDDVVIQEGAFTTDYFTNRQNELSVQEVAGGLMGEHDAAANAAMDLVLGGVDKSDTRTATKVLEQAEDTEDVVAARAAEKEILQDDADFSEAKPGSGAATTQQGTPREGSLAPGRSGLGLFVEAADTPAVEEDEAEPEYNAFGERIHNIDEYMVVSMTKQLEGTTLDLPKDKKKGKKKGRDTRRR
ncbi:SNF2 family domain-containing protein [Diaporthe helianthi]|uniref:DNA helicase n=1 Tax=Diaporthe helianthi TaxID=158607 RepID=A0A2P5I484_DIAHE|nr:SNF2 family domain-containing protein [Diaporthe helianthi]